MEGYDFIRTIYSEEEFSISAISKLKGVAFEWLVGFTLDKASKIPAEKELSRLMNLIKKHDFGDKLIDINAWERLGVSERIKNLEKEKSKIDAEVQKTNWTTDV